MHVFTFEIRENRIPLCDLFSCRSIHNGNHEFRMQNNKRGVFQPIVTLCIPYHALEHSTHFTYSFQSLERCATRFRHQGLRGCTSARCDVFHECANAMAGTYNTRGVACVFKRSARCRSCFESWPQQSSPCSVSRSSRHLTAASGELLHSVFIQRYNVIKLLDLI